MLSRFALAAVLALPTLAVEAQPATAPSKLAVTYEDGGAVATGVTPGGTVAWLGVSRSREDWSDHFYNWRLIAEDSDKDGVAAYPRKEGFPLQTVLVAIDITTGGFAVGATYPLLADVPSPVLAGPKADAVGLVSAFTHRGPKADILVVRPGEGAWAARVIDGGPLDQDRAADGAVTVGLAALPSRGERATRLDGLRPGDIVAIVDAGGPSVRVGRYTGNPGQD